MKSIFRTYSLLAPITSIVFFLLLAGCAYKEDQFIQDMAAKGVPPLSGPEVQQLFSNVTQTHGNSTGSFECNYSANRTMQGRAWGDWGEESDNGIWWVNDDNHFCELWFGEWRKYATVCYSIYPGNAKGEYTAVKVSGSWSATWKSGVIPLRISPDM